MNIRTNLILPVTIGSLGYIFTVDSMGKVAPNTSFRGGLQKRMYSRNRVRNGRSRSSKVADIGTNRKHVCDFLLVVNSNLGPILLRFSLFQTLCRFSAENITPSVLDPNFAGIPLSLECRLWGEDRSVIIFEVAQLI